MIDLRQAMLIRGDSIHRIDDASAQRSTRTPTGQIINRRSHSVYGRVIEGAGLDAIGRRRILNAQAVRRQTVENTRLRIQHADMRTVEFISRAQEKIGVHGAYVDREVRRVVNRVDHQQRVHSAGQAPREREVVHGSERVR